MKNDPRFSQEVKIAKDKAAGWSVKNLHAVDNVNVAQGPRTGNRGSMEKRMDFIDGKAERAGLADTVNRAYELRSPTTRSHTKITIDPTLENVVPDVKPKRFKR